MFLTKKKQRHYAAKEEYAFREGMRATLDLKAQGHSSKQIRNISKNYIGLDFGTRQKGYEAKKLGYQMISKDKPRQLTRYVKGSPTSGNKYILYDI